MSEEQRYNAVQAQINGFLDKAADKSTGGVKSFGYALLAAKMQSINSQSPYAKQPIKPVEVEKGINDESL